MGKRSFLILLAVLTGAVGFAGWFCSKMMPDRSFQKVNVLFIGNSITYGWNNHFDILRANFGDNIAVHGVGGIDTLDLYAILSPEREFRSRNGIWWWRPRSMVEKSSLGSMHYALKRYDPQIVVLEIGLNNLLRAMPGGNNEQTQNYRALRSYKGLDIGEIQEDAALGSINNRGVYQILWQIKEMYGKDVPVIVVGAFPTYYLPDPARFNELVAEFYNRRDDDSVLGGVYYLDPAPLSHVAWSEDYGMYYDHDMFPKEKEAFDTIHTDWGHLNEKGYEVYARMLECPVLQVVEGGEYDECGVVGAAAMNRGLEISKIE